MGMLYTLYLLSSWSSGLALKMLCAILNLSMLCWGSAIIPREYLDGVVQFMCCLSMNHVNLVALPSAQANICSCSSLALCSRMIMAAVVLLSLSLHHSTPLECGILSCASIILFSTVAVSLSLSAVLSFSFPMYWLISLRSTNGM